MTKLRDITCIGFDADDTLWHNEIYYLKAEREFIALLEGVAERDVIARAFAATESRNMALLGYGAKAMTISMIETALALHPGLAAATVAEIIAIGRAVIEMPIQMLPGVEDTLRALADRGMRIVIITKGELNEQTRKFRLSPLDPSLDYFVLPDKTVESYRRLFARERIDPSSFLMVGNSPKSDVLPPLELGCYAAHIPFETTWAHEDIPLPEHPCLIRLERFGDILDFV